jgi:hypothetical protein
MGDPIADGDRIADFHDEREYGRYYKLETFNTIVRPTAVNPFTKQKIEEIRIFKIKLVDLEKSVIFYMFCDDPVSLLVLHL